LKRGERREGERERGRKIIVRLTEEGGKYPKTSLEGGEQKKNRSSSSFQ